MPEQYPEERVRKALHEAGHAVLAEQSGLTVTEMTLNPPATHVRPYSREKGINYEADLLTRMGGAAAEVIAWDDPQLATTDYAVARKFADAVNLNGRQVMYNTLNEAETRLLLNWGQVTAVADALCRRGNLTGAEVRELMRNAPVDTKTRALGQSKRDATKAKAKPKKTAVAAQRPLTVGQSSWNLTPAGRDLKAYTALQQASGCADCRTLALTNGGLCRGHGGCGRQAVALAAKGGAFVQSDFVGDPPGGPEYLTNA